MCVKVAIGTMRHLDLTLELSGVRIMNVNVVNERKSWNLKNNVEINGDITTFDVKRQDGTVLKVIIDTEDLKSVSKYSWRSRLDKAMNQFYIISTAARGYVQLHRYIMKAPKGLLVDHINHDTLDNRKCNLRLADQSQNGQNRSGAQKNSRSGIRGVFWLERDQCWTAQVRIHGKEIYLGEFRDKEEARKVVEDARSVLMPYSEEARSEFE